MVDAQTEEVTVVCKFSLAGKMAKYDCRLLTKHHPHIMLLDIQMPHMDGFELLPDILISQAEVTDLQQERVSYLRYFIVKEEDRIFFVHSSSVEWIEAAGNYARIHVGEKSYLLREGLKRLEPKLDPRQFVRIHKSTIIKIESIEQLQSWSHGDYRVLLRDGTKLMLSRRYKERLQRSLGGNL